MFFVLKKNILQANNISFDSILSVKRREKLNSSLKLKTEGRVLLMFNENQFRWCCTTPSCIGQDCSFNQQEERISYLYFKRTLCWRIWTFVLGFLKAVSFWTMKSNTFQKGQGKRKISQLFIPRPTCELNELGIIDNQKLVRERTFKNSLLRPFQGISLHFVHIFLRIYPNEWLRHT